MENPKPRRIIDPNNKEDDKIMAILKDTLRTVVVSVIIVVVLTQFIIRPVRVKGDSMLPTLQTNDMGFSSIINYKISGLSRFDVVVFCPEDRSDCLVKRVIGLPGETVSYQDDQLYINGNYVEEDFLDQEYIQQRLESADRTLFTANFGPIQVADGEYFVMGDNRIDSIDSRSFGTISKSEIKSKYVFLIFPLNRFDILTNGK